MPNNNTLKITGIAELPEGMEMGHDYVVAGRMGIEDINKHDENNGEYTYQHKGKLTHIEVVNKVGKTFRGVSKGSKSQKLRWRIMQHGDNDYYEMVMSKLIDNLEDVIGFLKI